MEFIKLNNNRYRVKNSNNLIVSEEEKLKLEKKELVIKDVTSNECQAETTAEIQIINDKLEEKEKESGTKAKAVKKAK